MERTIRNLCVAMGIFICATVATLPLSSYAAVYDGTVIIEGVDDSVESKCEGKYNETQNKDQFRCKRTIDLTFTVNPAVEITAATGIGETDAIIMSPVTVGEGTFSATVTSNSSYSLYLSSDTYDTTADNFNPNATGSQGTVTTERDTAMVYRGERISASTEALSDESTLPRIAALPDGETLAAGSGYWAIKQETGHPTYAGLQKRLVEYYKDASIANKKEVEFTVGVAPGNNLPQGYYEGTVVITATAGNNSSSTTSDS